MANLQQNFVRIAVARPDGGVSVMQFMTLVKRNPEDKGFVREPTPENIQAEIAKANIPSTSWRIIQDTDIPQDRTFRNSWMDDGKTVTHDMTKARAIQMDRIRQARAPKLVALDAMWMKAVGQKDTVTADAIEAQRQKLRDLPQTTDLSKATDAASLKAIWPAELS
jgi:hypothetical protein